VAYVSKDHHGWPWQLDPFSKHGVQSTYAWYGAIFSRCRTTKFPREVPPLPWYRDAPAQMVMAGFLPFSAIYIELYYIFASIWGHKVYTIYSILFIVFLILIVVTAFITVALTYFQLAVEDHRWWWRSFLCGGSTAFFVLGYCFFYYHYRSAGAIKVSASQAWHGWGGHLEVLQGLVYMCLCTHGWVYPPLHQQSGEAVEEGELQQCVHCCGCQ